MSRGPWFWIGIIGLCAAHLSAQTNAAKQDVGTLLIVTGEDDVQVSIDGRPMRVTTRRGQLRLQNLPVKRYVISVSKEGFQRVPEERVTVTKGGEAKVAFQLRPISQVSTLHLAGAIPGTQVLLDGKTVGTVGQDQVVLTPGSHSIRLSNDEYKSKTFQLNFAAGKDVTLSGADVAFEGTFGTLVVAVSPAEAQLTIQRSGEAQARPLTAKSVRLAEGAYTVSATSPQFVPQSATLEITAGSTRRVTLQLVPEGAAPTPKQASQSGMAGWQSPAAWTPEGDHYTRKGGNLVLYSPQGPGTYTFSASMKYGRQLRWVAHEVDDKNYVEFELDGEYFYRRQVVAGMAKELVKRKHGLALQNGIAASLQIAISPAGIVQRIQKPDGWAVLDSWMDPSLQQGRFGLLIRGRDEINLSGFSFTGSEDPLIGNKPPDSAAIERNRATSPPARMVPPFGISRWSGGTLSPGDELLIRGDRVLKGSGSVTGLVRADIHVAQISPAGVMVVEEPSEGNNFTLRLRNNSETPVNYLQISWERMKSVESAIPTTSPPVPDPRAAGAEILELARSQYDAGQWSDAIANCNKALRLDPRSEPAIQLLKETYIAQGAAQQRAGKFDDAKLSFESAAAADPSDPQPKELFRTAERRVLSGIANLTKSKWEAAAADFKAALAIRPDPRASDGLAIVSVHTIYEAGLGAFRKQDCATASDKFSQLLKLKLEFRDKPTIDSLSPLFADAQVKAKLCGAELLLQTGIDQFNRGEYPSALTIFGEVLKNDPNNPRAMEQLMKLAYRDAIDRAVDAGRQKLDARDWDGALHDFENALYVNSDDVRAKDGQRQARNAIRTRQRNTMLAGVGIGIPAFALVIVMATPARRARVYARLGWRVKSEGVLNQILERNPTRSDILVALFHLYSRTGKRDKAIQAALRYLRLRPDDAAVLTLVGDAYLERREFELARQQFQHLLAIDPGSQTACSRLLASEDQSADSLSSADVYVREKALKANPENSCLNCLVSRYYVRFGRRNKRALEIYRRAVNVEPSNLPLRTACAEACWAQGDFEDAGRHAQEVLEHDPENRPMLLMFLRAAAKCGSLTNAFELVDSGRLDGLQVISACEEIVELDPGQRGAVHQRYQELTQKDGDTPAQLLSLAHLAIDDGSCEASLERVTAVAALDSPAWHFSPATGADALDQRETARVLARFLNVNQGAEGYPQRFAGLFFRLGELHRQLREPRAALAAFQNISRVPEWLVRCGKAMDEILEGLDARDLMVIYFREVGWNAEPPAADAEGIHDLVLNPPDVGASTLFSFFKNAKARCFDRTITLDDVVRLRRDLTDQDVLNREFTFVVSPLRPRQDVLALIYALLTEEPSLRVIPLEAISLKQAIIEGKSCEVLEQLLRLWVGQADLFDVHSPIADASTFFGRGHFIHALTTKIIQGENFGIFGLRKVGKTSLVFQLRENLPKNLIGYVDLQSVATRRCDEIYFRLSAALRREMRIKFPEAPQICSKLGDFDARQSYPSIASDFHNELLEIKEAIESCGQQPRILLLLDEITNSSSLLMPTIDC